MYLQSETFNAPYTPQKANPIADLELKCRQAAKRYSNGSPHLFEDLLQVGYETVLVCAKQFDPSKAGGETYRHFYSYASKAIHREVRDEAIKFGDWAAPMSLLPIPLESEAHELSEERFEAIKWDERDPRSEQPKKRGKTQRGKRQNTENRRVAFVEDEILDLYPDPSPNPETSLEIKQRDELLKTLIKIALDALDERLRFLITTRFGLVTGEPIDGEELKALYKARFGVKPSKLNTMYKRAFRLMRAALERAGYAAKSEAITTLFGI